jgi:hypothetical protein
MMLGDLTGDFTSKPVAARLSQWAARDRFLNGSGVGRDQFEVGRAGARRVVARRGDRVRRRASLILKALSSALNVSSSVWARWALADTPQLSKAGI